MFEKFVLCLWHIRSLVSVFGDAWEVCLVFLRCLLRCLHQSGNWRLKQIIAKIRSAKGRWQTKKTDNAEFDTYPVWSSAARAQTNVWQTTWQGKGNNLRTSQRENHSTQHDCKILKRCIETSRHGGRKEKQGQRRERLIRKTYRQTASSDSAEFDAESNMFHARAVQTKGKVWRTARKRDQS